MRSIDHYVLAVPDLATVRERYRRLGFTVALDGVHPFGTHNANMYFRGGPMVESLTMEHRGRYEQAVRDGNTFVANDAAFRATNGDDGFSHIVVTSEDADRDHADYLARGVSGGDLVVFTRDFEQPDGSIDTVSAKLAFATHPSAPSAFFFSCEDVIVPAVDRSSLLDHPNGAIGVVRAVSSTAAPTDYSDFMARLIGHAPVRTEEDTVEWQLPNGMVSVSTPAELKREFGTALTMRESELRHFALIFAVEDLDQTDDLLERNDQQFLRKDENLVAVMPGGFVFAFTAA